MMSGTGILKPELAKIICAKTVTATETGGVNTGNFGYAISSTATREDIGKLLTDGANAAAVSSHFGYVNA